MHAKILTYEEAQSILAFSAHVKVFYTCHCGATTLRQFRSCINAKRCSECYKQVQVEKRNFPPISMEEAARICSSGSKQPVFWKCSNCGNEQIKSYIQALKVKRCKKCNNKIRPKPDYSGKNNPSWKGGPKVCEECQKSVARRGKLARFCFDCGLNYNRKKLGWKNYTEEERKFFIEHRYLNDFKGQKWARDIKTQANFTCECCDKNSNGDLVSHHLNAWRDYPEQRYDLNNGVCLCKGCHNLFHRKYGKGANTRGQFEEFLISIKSTPK